MLAPPSTCMSLYKIQRSTSAQQARYLLSCSSWLMRRSATLGTCQLGTWDCSNHAMPGLPCTHDASWVAGNGELRNRDAGSWLTRVWCWALWTTGPYRQTIAEGNAQEWVILWTEGLVDGGKEPENKAFDPMRLYICIIPNYMWIFSQNVFGI